MGRTPLSYAAARGRTEVIQALIRQGARVNIIDKDSRTPLSHAAANRHAEAIQELLKAGALIELREASNICESAPLPAICGNNHNSAMMLLENGALINHKDRRHRTPLSHASERSKNDSAVRLLVSRGADIHLKDSDGRTPLHWAVIGGNEGAVSTLVDASAESDKGDNEKLAPISSTHLWLAISTGREEAAKILIRKGTNIHATDREEEGQHQLQSS
ncbi:ankyrin repeat-containing domain protein [Aspergillus heterothallicus]